MIFHRVARLIAFVIAIAAFSGAQKIPELKYSRAPLTSPTSAKEMFKAYCATCHGDSAKGNGPAAPALKIPPPDLTTLAKKNGGKFPADRVSTILRGERLILTAVRALRIIESEISQRVFLNSELIHPREEGRWKPGRQRDSPSKISGH